MANNIEPYDPSCGRYAKDMPELDYSWATSKEELDSTSTSEREANRRKYVLAEEGTLNMSNGHFLCDKCYIQAGQPSSPTGWVCP